MNFFTRYSSDFYRVFSYILFSFLFLYILLRAYFVEPLHDEAATLMHFVEPGSIVGKNMLIDANNHLLNSSLCRIIYFITGPDFFFLRLPNVAAFILYFWGIVSLLKPIKVNYSRGLLLLGINCIPFILEYFANARGYGLSLGFFVCSLAAAREAASTKQLRFFVMSYAFLILAVYSNLTFLVSAILALVLFSIFQFIYKLEMDPKERKKLWWVHLGFVLCLLPAIIYAKVLKSGGALYYGSLDGFWRVTGKTLTKYVLFYDHDWLKWLVIIGALAVIALMCYNWWRMGTWKFFKRTDTLLSWFLLGNAISIIILAKVLGVNYPEDRVGMYLVVLFLLLFGFIFGVNKSTALFMNLFLFFPLSFLTYINLSTSVFSPDDRMSRKFYEDVKKRSNPRTTISAYPLMQLTWAYLDRKSLFENSLTPTKEFNTAADIVLTKTELLPNFKAYLIDYDTIAYDVNSTFVGLIPKIAHTKTNIFTKYFYIKEAESEFEAIWSGDLLDSIKRTSVQIRVLGDVSIKGFSRDLNVVVTTYDEKEEVVRYLYWNERWKHGQKDKIQMNANFAIEELKANEKSMKVYIWNPQGAKVMVRNGTFEILKIE